MLWRTLLGLGLSLNLLVSSGCKNMEVQIMGHTLGKKKGSTQTVRRTEYPSIKDTVPIERMEYPDLEETVLLDEYKGDLTMKQYLSVIEISIKKRDYKSAEEDINHVLDSKIASAEEQLAARYFLGKINFIQGTSKRGYNGFFKNAEEQFIRVAGSKEATKEQQLHSYKFLGEIYLLKSVHMQNYGKREERERSISNAEEMFRQGLKLKVNDISLNYQLGQILMIKGSGNRFKPMKKYMLEESVKYFKTAIAFNTGSEKPEHYFSLGVALMQLQRNYESKINLEKAKKAYEELPDLKKPRYDRTMRQIPGLLKINKMAIEAKSKII